jgi:hypothetical protein
MSLAAPLLLLTAALRPHPHPRTLQPMNPMMMNPMMMVGHQGQHHSWSWLGALSA